MKLAILNLPMLVALVMAMMVMSAMMPHVAMAQEEGGEAASPSATTTSEAAGETESPKVEETQEAPTQTQAQAPKVARKEAKEEFNVHTHTNWGTYYDPQNIFCGKYDCYRILGFDFEAAVPDTKLITKRYRALSRAWHPDKSKHKDAKERFVKIARAYEVLTDREQRAEYDFMRYNQEAYFQKYGADVLWSYAPKSDATFILIALFGAINYFTWIAQKHRWQMVADRLVKAAVEDWAPSQGGTPESKELRERALKALSEQEKANNGTTTSAGATATTTTAKSAKSKKSKGKVRGKEKKEEQAALLRPIITEYVNEIDDFGAGFHKPTYSDLFVVRMAKFPLTMASGTIWQLNYMIRRLQKKELNDEEKEVLTQRAVGNVSWDLASDDDRASMIKQELWIKDNLLEWKEAQEIKNLSKSDQKYINKLKKRGIKAE
eukprot:CAMPEP_0119550818 /NCGR_PEP_ID=MMETSP1352-20130426/4268_1 /TAXON_ID=265584 /ORGANISM="Stauroneis constricta, Strain CCMP1120" /LENGTH=434 /DNA_ID=CAMNT_0007596787 /DNA_START=109 /DNA_END=1413 /DNA_ORIENTATION=-